MEWVINNVGLLVSWAIALFSLFWAAAVKFAKMEQKDSHQEERIKKLEERSERTEQRHADNESRLIKLETVTSHTQTMVESLDKKFDDRMNQVQSLLTEVIKELSTK